MTNQSPPRSRWDIWEDLRDAWSRLLDRYAATHVVDPDLYLEHQAVPDAQYLAEVIPLEAELAALTSPPPPTTARRVRISRRSRASSP